MRLPHKAHLAIVDGEQFILRRNAGTPDDPRLEEETRPDLTTTNYSAGVRHQDSASQLRGITDLEELAHAAAVAEWLNAAVLDGRIDRLAIIADPKTLGEMRRHYHKQLEAALVGEEAQTMTGEPRETIEKALQNA